MLRVFFRLWVSSQIKLRRIKRYRDIEGGERLLLKKKEFHDFTRTVRYSLSYRIRDKTPLG